MLTCLVQVKHHEVTALAWPFAYLLFSALQLLRIAPGARRDGCAKPRDDAAVSLHRHISYHARGGAVAGTRNTTAASGSLDCRLAYAF
jgi:hypothetical protein